MHRGRVSENVYWLQSEVYAQVTAGVVAGPQWAVVIDTLALPEETMAMREFIEHEVGVRGEVIQESALVDAIKREVIAGAGLDVFEKEPPDAGNPLFQIPKVILTPHSAALTKDSVAKLAEGAAENALRVLEGRPPSFSPNWDTVQSKTK